MSHPYRRAPRAVASAVVVALAGALPAAGADSLQAAAAFREADGYIDRGEFHERAVELFFFADADRDGAASAAELGRVSLDPEGCAAADRDGDGRISLPEFVELRFAGYRAADRDGDGRLSAAEVEASYAAH